VSLPGPPRCPSFAPTRSANQSFIGARARGTTNCDRPTAQAHQQECSRVPYQKPRPPVSRALWQSRSIPQSVFAPTTHIIPYCLSLAQFWISDAKLDHRNRRFQLICPSLYCCFSLLQRCYKKTTAAGENIYQQNQRKAHLLLLLLLIPQFCPYRPGTVPGGTVLVELAIYWLNAAVNRCSARI